MEQLIIDGFVLNGKLFYNKFDNFFEFKFALNKNTFAFYDELKHKIHQNRLFHIYTPGDLQYKYEEIQVVLEKKDYCVILFPKIIEYNKRC